MLLAILLWGSYDLRALPFRLWLEWLQQFWAVASHEAFWQVVVFALPFAQVLLRLSFTFLPGFSLTSH
jgi:hypothetical protein